MATRTSRKFRNLPSCPGIQSCLTNALIIKYSSKNFGKIILKTSISVAGVKFMALTKTIIAEKIQNKLNLSRTETYEIMEELLEIIKQTIENGEDIMISGFGKFCVNEKKARKGRNPATDEEMILPARRVVTFKCSGKLRDMINS